MKPSNRNVAIAAYPAVAGKLEAPEQQKLPDPPSTLGEEGVLRWYQLGNSLVARNIWSDHYCAVLEHACRLYDQIATLNYQLWDAETGTEALLVAGKFGPHLNPLAQLRKDVTLQIRTVLVDLGMTPNSAKTAGPASADGNLSNGRGRSGLPRRPRGAIPSGA